MQAFSWLSGNKALAYGAAALALVVAALLILLVFRLAFGRRLRMSGRGRQLRLGIVDAFDLDRQRQLVIVRRDNTEHLIMIGGPNDILIESQIIRAEAREGRQREKERDRDHREKDFAEPVQLPPAQPLKPAAAEPQLPPFVPEAPPAPVAPTPVVQPVARTQLSPITPRRTAPRPEPKPTTPVVPPVEKLPEPAAPSFEPVAPPPAVEVASPAAAPPTAKPAAPAPGFMRWRPGQSPAGQPRPAGPGFTQPIRQSEPSLPPASPAFGSIAGKPSEPPAELPSTLPSPAPATPDPETPAVTQPAAEDLMVSLEEEMAKLLGRASDKP
jgi:flagellar protein FliO/FliZ